MALAAVTLGGPARAAAQGTVLSAALSADITAADGSARVRIDYALESDARTVDVELLGFGAATADELVVLGTLGGPLPLHVASGTRKAADLSLPSAGTDGVTRLSLAYHVPRAVERSSGRLRVRVPVASVSLPPPAGVGRDVFTAEVRLPEGWSVTEGFPSGLARREDGAYAVALAVVPAVVTFRGRSDGRRPPGVPLLLSGLAGLIVLGAGLAGWRHLRSIAA